MVADHLCERLAKLYEEGRYRAGSCRAGGFPHLALPRRGGRARWGGREHRAGAWSRPSHHPGLRLVLGKYRSDRRRRGRDRRTTHRLLTSGPDYCLSLPGSAVFCL